MRVVISQDILDLQYHFGILICHTIVDTGHFTIAYYM